MGIWTLLNFSSLVRNHEPNINTTIPGHYSRTPLYSCLDEHMEQNSTSCMKGHMINITTFLTITIKCVEILNRGSNNDTKLIALIKLLATNQIAEKPTNSMYLEIVRGFLANSSCTCHDANI